MRENAQVDAPNRRLFSEKVRRHLRTLYPSAANGVAAKPDILSGVSHGPYLLVLTVAAIAMLLALILWARMHAFLAMFAASIALGLAAGMRPLKVLQSVQNGFGDALSFIAVVVALGAMIGKFIEHSGGGAALSDSLLEKLGQERAAWAVLAAAFLVGLPVFFEVGFIILAPMALVLARESRRPVLLFGMPLAAALTVTHSLVPPHPAPVVAAQLLGADAGRIILWGTVLSVPLIVAGGIFFGGWIARRLPQAGVVPPASTAEAAQAAPPSTAVVVLLLVLPVALIFSATAASSLRLPGAGFWQFVGHPFTALLVSAFATMYLLGIRRGLSLDRVTRLATESLSPLATLLLIIGAGGGLKQIIVDCGVGNYAGALLASAPVSPLLVAFLTSALLRAAQGSATVAIVTAAGILAPVMGHVAGYSQEILVLAVCCGGTSVSHVNDAGFWIVKEYLGLTVAETLRSWTTMKLLMGALGLAILLAVHALAGR